MSGNMLSMIFHKKPKGHISCPSINNHDSNPISFMILKTISRRLSRIFFLKKWFKMLYILLLNKKPFFRSVLMKNLYIFSFYSNINMQPPCGPTLTSEIMIWTDLYLHYLKIYFYKLIFTALVCKFSKYLTFIY